jgi:hypothetical protein
MTIQIMGHCFFVGAPLGAIVSRLKPLLQVRTIKMNCHSPLGVFSKLKLYEAAGCIAKFRHFNPFGFA